MFCGHYHRNARGFYEDLEVITTTAIGAQLGDADKSGMRVVKVFSNEIQHDYYPFEDFPDKVEFQ